MKIKYIHSSSPDKEIVYDTKVSLNRNRSFFREIGKKMTQEKWDESELAKFERERKAGNVLSYAVIEEE